jgi:hypothetical protein
MGQSYRSTQVIPHNRRPDVPNFGRLASIEKEIDVDGWFHTQWNFRLLHRVARSRSHCSGYFPQSAER